MKIIKIPVSAYLHSNTSKRVDIPILFSNAIVNAPKSYVWADQECYNIAPYVNEYIGDTLLSNQYTLYTVYNNSTENPTNRSSLLDDIDEISKLLGLRIEVIEGGNVQAAPNKLVCLNNKQLNNWETPLLGTHTSYRWYQVPLVTGFINPYDYVAHLSISNVGDESTSGSVQGYILFQILPELPMFNNDGAYLSDEMLAADAAYLYVRFTLGKKDGKRYVSQFLIAGYNSPLTQFKQRLVNNVLSNFETKLSGINETTTDIDDPYGINGTSTTGGGDGTLVARGLDEVDPAVIPDLPSVNAAQLGFITMYNPSPSQLNSLADFMWSNMFDLNTYKKLFADPMESIIGLAIVPINPTIGGVKNVHFGTIDSGVNMSYLSTNWASLDCGWCSIEKYIGAFLDGDPYTKISIYLPFIGIRQLAADDVNGRMIHVVYHVDVLTGACAAFIEVEGRGVMYTYNGSCITNIPLTSVNFSGAIQNAVSAVISGIGTVAGIATGAAPVTAMGAAGLLNSAANAAINSKPSVQRSGNLGGSAGIMSIMRPYIIIERPDLSVPENIQHYVGQTSNITMKLDNCSGFTMCDYIHIENVPGMSEEIAEIEALLKEGVYL